MSKTNTSDRKYSEKVLYAEFIDCQCMKITATPEEYDENISEIHMLIQHFIDIGNTEEVKYWRGFLQQTKVEKRNVVKMINKNEMEMASA